jgi:hypothetical protein
MRPLITAAVAITLLLHALAGCCWHHQHVAAAESTPSDEAQILPVVCGGHFHSHAHRQQAQDDEPGAPADHRHSDDEGCGEPACQFVRVDSSTVPSLLDGPTVAIVAAIQPTVHDGWRHRSRDHRGGHILEGVPLHLRHQVLLI